MRIAPFRFHLGLNEIHLKKKKKTREKKLVRLSLPWVGNVSVKGVKANPPMPVPGPCPLSLHVWCEQSLSAPRSWSDRSVAAVSEKSTTNTKTEEDRQKGKHDNQITVWSYKVRTEESFILSVNRQTDWLQSSTTGRNIFTLQCVRYDEHVSYIRSKKDVTSQMCWICYT